MECKFQWDQYTKVVNDTDTQNGVMYFRRSGSNVEMAAHIEKPDTKIVVFSNGIVRIYTAENRHGTAHRRGQEPGGI